MGGVPRAAASALWRRWWTRVVVVGLTPPFVPFQPARGTAPAPATGWEADAGAASGLLSQAACELVRVAEMILRLPRAECPSLDLGLISDGWVWLWRITPAHFLWAALAAAVLWWAARRDYGEAMDSPAVRVGWEAAKAAGLAYVVKMAASAVVGMAREMAPAVELLR